MADSRVEPVVRSTVGRDPGGPGFLESVFTGQTPPVSSLPTLNCKVVAVHDADLVYLGRCVELAREALDNGDAPFGSILVDGDGRVVCEDRNRTGGGDATRHPEFAIARWAAVNLAPAQRVQATVYTSCEHCPMCAAAHGWVGLGRIVYATSAAQLHQWLTDVGASTPPVAPLPISAVVPKAVVDGPVPGFADELKALYQGQYRR